MPSQSSPSPVSDARSNIGANIRRIRKAMGLTQEELGELAEFHRTYVSQLERCETNISVDGLERFAKVLGVDAIQLMQPPPDDASATPTEAQSLEDPRSEG